jgi:nucleotide-binding universal stress UspA family protein
MTNYRNLLVHLDSSAPCASRIDLAIGLALEHGAHLLGVAACGWPVPPAAVAGDLLGFGPLLQISDDHRAGAERACEAFADRARQRGLGSYTARIEEVAGAQYLVQMARCHDLSVVGQPQRAGSDPLVPADLPVQLLMGAGRPLLAVPWAGHFEAAPRNVLVAWSDSRESARALADALPLLTRADSVHLLALVRPRADASATMAQLEAVQHWLGLHGVATRSHLDVVDLDFGEALLSRVTDLGADVIVMGGYGHARAAEFILGGMTKTVLSGMTVPVLMSH